jgi:hypothetical protein
MAEQVAGADRRAREDVRSKTSATWIAKGDHLVLLVVSAQNSRKLQRKFYRCAVLDVIEEES